MTTPYGQDPWQPPAQGAPPPWGAPPPGAPQSATNPAAGPPPWGANPWQPAGAPAWGGSSKPNEPTAITSCVIGILSVLTLPIAAALVDGNRPAFVGAALIPGAAIVTGHLARRRIRTDPDNRGGGGLAITGLVCGWLALAVLAFVLAVQPDVHAARIGTIQDGTGFAVPAPQAPQEGVPTRPDTPVQEPATARGILTGTVRGLDGELVPGATVTVRRADPGDRSDTPACPLTATTTTGAVGEWFLPLCQLGDGIGWSVEIHKGELGASTPLAYVNSGRTTTYDVRLSRVY